MTIKTEQREAGEMTQELRALSSLPEDLDLVPSMHGVLQPSVITDSEYSCSLASMGAVHMWCIYAKASYTENNKYIFKQKRDYLV